MTEPKEEIYNLHWTFSGQVRVGTLRVMSKEGPIDVTRISLIDRKEKCKIECKGQLAGRPKWSNTMRTVTYNLNGYNQHPPPPPEVTDLLKKYAFPRDESIA